MHAFSFLFKSVVPEGNADVFKETFAAGRGSTRGHQVEKV